MTKLCLADEYARAKELQEAVDSEVQAIRQRIIASNKSIIIGEEATVSVTETEFKRLVMTRVKALLTIQQIRECMNVTKGHIVRIKSRKKEKPSSWPSNH